jgi:hypothetical protein
MMPPTDDTLLQRHVMGQKPLNYCFGRGCIYVLLHFLAEEVGNFGRGCICSCIYVQHVLQQQPCMLVRCSSEQQLARLVRL